MASHMTSPPTSPSDPRADATVIPITQAIALVARPEAIDHALVESIRASRMFELTLRSLLSRKQSLQALKKRRSKELGLVETRAAESLGAQVTGEDLVKFNEAARRVVEAIDNNTVPARADVAIMIGHNAEIVKRFRAQAAAEAAKKAEAKRLQGRIEELQLALEKLIERGTGRQEPTPQQALPGIDAVDPDPEDWMDKATKSTVITTVAYEVRRAEKDITTATEAGDNAALLAARRRAEDHANLLRELRAAGITGEPEESQDDDTLDLDFELADEAVSEGSDDEDEGDDDSEPDTTSAAPHPADPEPQDPTTHPALAGAIAATKAKRAAEKQTKSAGSKRGRGSKK